MGDTDLNHWCTVCLARCKHEPAVFVASGPTIIPNHPMQWFECANHDADDNLAGKTRAKLEPLGPWLERIEREVMRLPEGQLWDRADRVRTRQQ